MRCRFGTAPRGASHAELEAARSRCRKLLTPGASPARLPGNDGDPSFSTLRFPSLDESRLRELERKWKFTFFTGIRWNDSELDRRILWEPSRLQDVTRLLHLEADSGAGTTDDRRRAARERVLYWIQDHPFPWGPQYASAMECALRIPVFFYCLKQAPERSSEDSRRILTAIHQHAWWVSKRLSLHSSRGNHTVAEAVGLVFAGSIFKATRGAWLETGIRLLRKELPRQILPDGGPAEQSFNYHRFVVDLGWLAVDFLERNTLHPCADITEHLAKGEAFLRHFALPGGSLPSIGDSDDGWAMAPGLRPSRSIECRESQVIAERAVSLDSNDDSLPDIKGIRPHDTREAQPVKRRGGLCESEMRTFSDSGYTLVRTAQGLSLVLDHGPLGMPPLFNHGHADALSVTVSVHDLEMLVDPGTYRYNGAPRWRSYFKSTRAHNTVTIDGRDQARQETGFIWSRPYTAGLAGASRGPGFVRLEAWHDGYSRGDQPVIHRRTLTLFDGGILVIQDSFEGEGRRCFDLNFHLHPECALDDTGEWLRFSRNHAVVYMKSLEGFGFQPIRGEEDPIFGWYSPSYGTKIETVSLNSRRRGRPAEISFTTLISMDPPPDEGPIADITQIVCA